jgi:hypothetical protein
MKKQKMILVLLVCLVAFGLVMVSCDDSIGGGEPTYTVWTVSMFYSDFTSLTGETLQAGYYYWLEFTNSEFSQSQNQNPQFFTNENRHQWTESQIRTWLIGRELDTSRANQATAWLITVNHGSLVTRSSSGAIVDIIVK